MKCQACNTEISDRLKASISRNFCPFCGSDIMSAQILQLKSVIKESVIKASSSENMKNLDSLEVIDAFSGIIAADIAVFVNAKVPVAFVSSKSSAPQSQDFHPSASASEIPEVVKEDADPSQGVVVPSHMRPVNKKAPKAVTRGGERLSPAPSIESPGLSLSDLKNLENSLSGDIGDLGGFGDEGDIGGFQNIEDSDFFNAGDTDDVTVAEVDGESVMFGVSNSGMKERAMVLKQKHEEIKKRGGIKGINNPVSRSG